MRKMNRSGVLAALQAFVSEDAYIHSEAPSHVFVRNFKVRITEAFAAGEGPFRIGLRFDGIGWIRTEGITHFEIDEAGRLIMSGYDDKGRMNVCLELGKEPFPE